MKKKQPLILIEDSREQTPLDFSKFEGVEVERAGLDTGDYSIKGWEQSFAIERKSLEDFSGTMINAYQPNTQKPRLRFNNELERLRHFDFAAVIVTAPFYAARNFCFHCGKPSNGALVNFAASIFATYQIPVFFLDSPEIAAEWIVTAAKHFIITRTKKNRTIERGRKKKISDADLQKLDF